MDDVCKIVLVLSVAGSECVERLLYVRYANTAGHVGHGASHAGRKCLAIAEVEFERDKISVGAAAFTRQGHYPGRVDRGYGQVVVGVDRGLDSLADLVGGHRRGDINAHLFARDV